LDGFLSQRCHKVVVPFLHDFLLLCVLLVIPKLTIMNSRTQLAEKIIAERKKKGLTQEQLAEEAKVSIRTIQRLEAGKVKPQLNTLCQLAQIFEIDIEELTAFEEKKIQQNIPVHPQYSKLELILLQLSPLGIFILPGLGHILTPLLYWFWKGKENRSLYQQALTVINFQLSLTLYFVIILIITFVFAFSNPFYKGGFFTVFVILSFGSLGLSFFGFMLLNIIRVSKGKELYYPLTISFLKENKNLWTETEAA
jgi:serine-type D-Ala-D-Ala carboxypeptidase/endopeptidase